MPEFCSCGAQLPPDALFCHKCGKPQRENSFVEAEQEHEQAVPSVPEPEIVVQPAAPAVPVVRHIDFHNPTAVRTGMIAAVLASLLILLPVVNLGCPLWLLSAGFVSVYIYSRRTGNLLPTRDGMRMGWITGVFSFVIFTVLFTVNYVAMVLGGGSAALKQEQSNSVEMMKQLGLLGDNAGEALKMMQNPAMQVAGLIMSLVFLFVLFTLLPLVGGWIGARVMQKD